MKDFCLVRRKGKEGAGREEGGSGEEGGGVREGRGEEWGTLYAPMNDLRLTLEVYT